MGTTIEIAARTDVGRMREHNEDNFIVANITSGAVGAAPNARLSLNAEPALLMVADGVGGAASGELASAMGVQTVWEQIRLEAESNRLFGGGQTPHALLNALLAANSAIHKRATSFAEHKGMATTATTTVIAGSNLYVAQIGDSRAYLIRNGEARQITKDQSLIQKLVDAGRLTQEQAEHSDKKNIILQALGTEPVVTPEITRERLISGDTLVLCSDGLSNMVKPADIARIAALEPNIERACELLVDSANAAGGRDNITVIVARISIAEMGDTQPMPAVKR